MKRENKKRRLTPSEQRFVEEVNVMMRMSLTELLLVEQTRIPVAV